MAKEAQKEGILTECLIKGLYNYKVFPLNYFMRYSYKALREIIRSEIVGQHDAIVEGGIGFNFSRHDYLRNLSFDGLYIGVNDESSPVSVPEDLIYCVADCFDGRELSRLFTVYGLQNPVFLTNNSLGDCLLHDYGERRIRKAVKTLTEKFSKQLHTRPAGTITAGRKLLEGRGEVEDKVAQRFVGFIKESTRIGWEVCLPSPNIILMKK